MYFIYRILTAFSMIFLAPYYAFRAWRHGETVGAFGERWGHIPPAIAGRAPAGISAGTSQSGAIWIHAVSVGEVLAARPLAQQLQRRFGSRTVLVSTTTETGQRLARERLAFVDGIFYFPIDWVPPVRRALRAIGPALVIVMETEIWPNFLREAHRQKVPVIFANARISDRSFARYQRWRFIVEPLYSRVLANAELFLAQTPDDATRLEEMGAPRERIAVTGNLKYDSEPPKTSPWGAWLAGEIRRQERWPVIVAGSVVADEEEAVLAGYDIVQRRWRRALLILAPRKPDRFDAAAAAVGAGGWKVVRRSCLNLDDPLDETADVLLLDTIGELAGLYPLADAVFIGGSLVPAGGHNILEPAWFAKPPVFGPSMENFRDMATQFLRARAAIQVASGQQLGKVWGQLIEDSGLREQMGRAARELSERNRGATVRSVERIAAVLGQWEQSA
jgi:3-deoxy-D-manno-octulosonic-acid transferase